MKTLKKLFISLLTVLNINLANLKNTGQMFKSKVAEGLNGLFCYYLRFKQVLHGIISIIIKNYDPYYFSGGSAQFDSKDTATPRGTRAFESHKTASVQEEKHRE